MGPRPCAEPKTIPQNYEPRSSSRQNNFFTLTPRGVSLLSFLTMLSSSSTSLRLVVPDSLPDLKKECALQEQ